LYSVYRLQKGRRGAKNDSHGRKKREKKGKTAGRGEQ
jgi:hypothetical protein